MNPLTLLSLASGLKGGGGAKSSSTSNVASTNTVNVANVIGAGTTGGMTGGSPASASPSTSLSDATDPSMPIFGGENSSTGFDATYDLGNEAGTGIDFTDPVVIGFGALAIFAAWYLLK